MIEMRSREPAPVEAVCDEVSQWVTIVCFVPLASSLLFVFLQPYLFVPLFVFGLPAAVISGEAIGDSYQRRWSTPVLVYIESTAAFTVVAQLSALLLWLLGLSG